MNLSVHSKSHSDSVVSSFFPERILPSCIVQNKKIILIASLAFGLLALCYVVVRHCLKPKFKASLEIVPPLNGKGIKRTEYAIEEGTFVNGQLYQGQKKNLRGRGSSVSIDDSSLEEGTFINGQLQGQGTRRRYIQIENGEFAGVDDSLIETGEFNQGVLHGRGTIIFKDLPVWQGNVQIISYDTIGYIEGQRDGRWVGEFQNGKIHDGMLTLSNGTIAQGIFQNGKIHDGILTLSDGTVAQGIFENGKLLTGIITFRDGRIKEFKDGTLIKQKLTNGDVLEKGTFQVFHNRYDGTGQVTKQNGEVRVGTFSFGHLNGEGEIIFPSNMRYKGQFKDGIFLSGEVSFPQGIVRKGVFTTIRRLVSATDFACYITHNNTFVEMEKNGSKRVEREFFTDGKVKETEYEGSFFVQERTFNLSDLTREQFFLSL